MTVDKQQHTFLANICRHPGDDEARLTFANWPDEHDTGAGMRAARAPFIRVKWELANSARDNQ